MLRAALGLNTRQVDEALDWRPSHVSKIQCQYIRVGDAAFRAPGRGGDRRPTHLRPGARQALLEHLAYLHRNRGLRLSYRTIKAECEAAAGHPLNRSTIYRIMRRQGWRSQDLQRDFASIVKVALRPENASNWAAQWLRSNPELGR